MFLSFMTRLRRRRLAFACMAALIIGVPTSCAVLEHRERKLLFRIEPGTAGWYHGLPGSVQEFDLQPGASRPGRIFMPGGGRRKKPMRRPSSICMACAGTSPGRLFRIEQLRAAGYSVLAIDYRGFGQSKGDLPSEAAFTKTPVWRGSVSNCCSPTRASA
jgi:hypothetical protein